jgi:hypothetical protein
MLYIKLMANSSYRKRSKKGRCIKGCGRKLSEKDKAESHVHCKPCRDDLKKDIQALRDETRDWVKLLERRPTIFKKKAGWN